MVQRDALSSWAEDGGHALDIPAAGGKGVDRSNLHARLPSAPTRATTATHSPAVQPAVPSGGSNADNRSAVLVHLTSPAKKPVVCV